MNNTLRIFNIKGEEKHKCTEFGKLESCITQIKHEKQSLLAIGSHENC
jgi:hypothetical protein